MLTMSETRTPQYPPLRKPATGQRTCRVKQGLPVANTHLSGVTYCDGSVASSTRYPCQYNYFETAARLVSLVPG